MDTILSYLQKLPLRDIITCILVLLIGFTVAKILNRLFARGLNRSQLDKSLHTFLKALFKILLYVIVVLTAASSLGVDVTSLIALLSVASLAISLAVQDTLANVAGGIMILSSHPFGIGDWVEVGGNSGSVEKVGLSYTTLRTGDNKIVYIPNKDVATSRVVNYSTEDARRVDLSFTASYDSDVDTVIEALTEAASLPLCLPEKPVFVRVMEYKESDIQYVVRVWVKNADYWDAYFAITQNVKKIFDEKGVTMTYPHTIVHLEK